MSELSEIRRHYYLEQYVVMAPKRSRRPHYFDPSNAPHVVKNSTCPFCSDSEETLFAIPNEAKWDVKVIKNAFPALSLTNPSAYGSMEVVIETPRHDIELSDLPVAHIEDIFKAYINRIEVLSQLPGISYVLPFKNDGPLAGASVAHAHSQIIALPLVPPKFELESTALNHYFGQHGTCAVCDLAAWEADQNIRVVHLDSQLIAINPYASSHAYETWFIPRRHISRLNELTANELRALAKSLKQVATKLDEAIFSFNFYVQEALPGQTNHLMIKLEPRLAHAFGGAELASGVIINPVPPEDAAIWYTTTAQK